jgi:hypothetical protein
MNAFEFHHRAAIKFGYSCFDHLLFNTFIQSLQIPGAVYHFLHRRRQAKVVSPAYLRKISSDYHTWVSEFAEQNGFEIVPPPADVRRNQWVQPYYQQLGQHSGVAVILRCREWARVAVSYPSRNHEVALTNRCVDLYYFYLQDPQLGRLFLRVCPYFPFSVRVCLNGHQWLARQLDHEGIAYRLSDNVFVDCANPDRLQVLSDAFGPQHILAGVEPWLARLLPFFTEQDRRDGYRHQLYMTQVEYCHNLIFHKAAALDRLFSRVLDANRCIGQPDNLATIFGRQNFRADTRTAKTEVKITCLRTPVIRTNFLNTSVKQYIKDHVAQRTESASSQLGDLSVAKHIKNLPKARAVLGRANDRYLQAQQDILASYIDRGQLQQLRQPTVSASGRRTPGLRLDDPRLLAVMQALTCFTYLVGQGGFRTKEALPEAQRALNDPTYTLSQFRYDLAKLRGKGLVLRQPGTQRYHVTTDGYRIAVLYQKLYHRLYAPLIAAIQSPVPADTTILSHRQTKLDRLYVAVDTALIKLADHVGIAA